MDYTLTNIEKNNKIGNPVNCVIQYNNQLFVGVIQLFQWIRLFFLKAFTGYVLQQIMIYIIEKDLYLSCMICQVRLSQFLQIPNPIKQEKFFPGAFEAFDKVYQFQPAHSL